MLVERSSPAHPWALWEALYPAKTFSVTGVTERRICREQKMCVDVCAHVHVYSTSDQNQGLHPELQHQSIFKILTHQVAQARLEIVILPPQPLRVLG